MPLYDIRGEYDSLKKDVNENTQKHITVEAEQALQDEKIVENESANIITDVNLKNLEDEVDLLVEAIAQGGVIVNRKIGAIADVPFSGVEAKVAFPNTLNETNESSVITFDANNDHVLITKGQYSVTAQLVLINTSAQPRTATLNLYAKDLVTLVETLIDTTGVINLTALETVNLFPQYTYDKVSDNNIVLFVRQIGETVVNLGSESSLHVNSIFTVAGSGVVTQSKNIAPTSAVSEGVNENEVTIAEIFENLKGLIIEKDISTGNTRIKRDGTTIIQLDSSGNMLMNANGKIRDLGDPTASQDAVTKAFMEALIVKSLATDNTVIFRDGVSKIVIGSSDTSISSNRLSNVADPINSQDVVTKAFIELVIENDIAGTQSLLKVNGSSKWAIDSAGNLISLIGNRRVTNIGNPTADQDAVTKIYVDSRIVRNTILSQGNPVTGTYYNLTDLASYIDVTYIIEDSGNNVYSVPASDTQGLTIITKTGWVDLEFSGTTVKVVATSGTTVTELTAIGIGKK